MKETLFASQGRYGKDPKRIDRRGTRHNHLSKISWFNCEREGCAISRCTAPRDNDRIFKNLKAWRKEKGINKSVARIHLDEMVGISGEEIAEAFLDERIISENASSDSEDNEKEGENYDPPRDRRIMDANLCAHAIDEVRKGDADDLSKDF